MTRILRSIMRVEFLSEETERMARSAARESLFKLIYEYNIRQERDDLTLSLFLRDLTEDDAAYLESSYNGILEHADELVSVIARYSKSFARDRIYKVDLAILMVAAYEIFYRDDIPQAVCANEATGLAKKYSTDKSWSFVNGLLASVIKEKNKDVG